GPPAPRRDHPGRVGPDTPVGPRRRRGPTGWRTVVAYPVPPRGEGTLSTAMNPAARATARRVSTVARWVRYSAEAVVSLRGEVPSAACAAGAATPSGPAPASACSTALARTGVGPMFVSATRASPMVPLARRTAAATATVAHAWAVRDTLA